MSHGDICTHQFGLSECDAGLLYDEWRELDNQCLHECRDGILLLFFEYMWDRI